MAIAACALDEAKLNRVLFLPTGNPPHKHDGLEDAEHRFEMTRLATLREPRYSASRIEIDRAGVIYTVDTLIQLRKQWPDAELFYMIGEDTLLDLPNWRTPDRVFELCTFLVCRRSTWDASGHPLVKSMEARGAKFQYLSLPPAGCERDGHPRRAHAGPHTHGVAHAGDGVHPHHGAVRRNRDTRGADAMYPRLRLALSEKRLLHSLLVAATARRLAALHSLNQEECELAGLLHDCAKCMPLQTLQHIAKDHRLLLDKETFQSDNLLHGPVGAVIAETEYGGWQP